MKVNFKLEPDLSEVTVEIRAPNMSEEVENLLKFIENSRENQFIGKRGNERFLFKEDDIERFYSGQKKVFLVTKTLEEFQINDRLYQLEERLSKGKWIRISNSEIVALREIEKLELNKMQEIILYTKQGSVCYVSRSYIKSFKEALKL